MAKMRSVEANRAAWNAPAKGVELLLLQALSNFAGETFECHPSVATLARMIRKSERQTIRLLHRLRDRKLIHFEDNRGGTRKCNQYRLLYALNPDMNPDKSNPDINTNPDILKSGTLSNSARTVTNSARTVTKSTANPDIAMSGEGLKGFESIDQSINQWVSQISQIRSQNQNQNQNPDALALQFLIRENVKAFTELEDTNPADLITKIQNGSPVTRKAVCEVHGQFVLTGRRFDNWIAWDGRAEIYSPGWTCDEGSCPGCHAERQRLIAAEPEKFWERFPRQFALETPAFCQVHGDLILKAGLRVYSDRMPKVFVDEEWMDHCPDCQGRIVYESDVREALSLSYEEWEVRGERIMAALED